MDSTLACKVFYNPLIFEKIAKHLWLKDNLHLRRVSKGFNEHIITIIGNGTFQPRLSINKKKLTNYKVTDINPLFCSDIHFTEPEVECKRAGKAKEAWEQFFSMFHDNVEKLRYKFHPRHAFWMFEHIWNNNTFSSLKEVYLALDHISGISNQENGLAPKENVLKLSVNYRSPIVNRLLMKIINATPNLQEIEIGANSLPPFRMLNLPNLKKFTWGSLDSGICNRNAALPTLSKTIEQFSESLECLNLYFPNLQEYSEVEFVVRKRMDKLRKLQIVGIQAWESLMEENLPNLEELYIHSALPFEGALTLSDEMKGLLKKWERERINLPSVKNVTLCHILNPAVVEGLLNLFPRTEKLKIDCCGCWQIGRGDDSWFSSSGIHPMLGRGNWEGLVPNQFKAWIKLLGKVGELKELKNLTCYYYHPRPFPGNENLSPESLMQQQINIFLKMMSGGLKVLNLIQHRGNHGATSLHEREMITKGILEIFASSSGLRAVTLGDFYMDKVSTAALKSRIESEKLPVHFTYCERLGLGPLPLSCKRPLPAPMSTSQCCLYDGNCYVGVTTCPKGTVNTGYYCGKLGPCCAPVKNGTECVKGGGVCLGGVRQCPLGTHLQESDCLGEICCVKDTVPNTQCVEPVGTCFEGREICPLGSVPVDSDCPRGVCCKNATDPANCSKVGGFCSGMEGSCPKGSIPILPDCGERGACCVTNYTSTLSECGKAGGQCLGGVEECPKGTLPKDLGCGRFDVLCCFPDQAYDECKNMDGTCMVTGCGRGMVQIGECPGGESCCKDDRCAMMGGYCNKKVIYCPVGEQPLNVGCENGICCGMATVAIK